MNDLEKAKSNLSGHTICLCKGGNCICSEKRGVAPMMDFIAEGRNLRGYSVADIVVGKAAAMLFVKCGIVAVFGKTLSKGAQEVLEKYGVVYEYQTLTDAIINRAGTDICPMEKTVSGVCDIESAYIALKQTLNNLMEQNK